MLEALETLGGNMQCASSRESIMYQTSVFNKDVPTMMGILAETVRDALITDEEVSQQLETAEYEINEIWAKPELILPELIHTAAFQGNTLGNPLLCPEDRLDQINKQVIEEYRSVFFRPERLVVAFAGVEHTTAVKLAEKYFGDMTATPPKTNTEPAAPSLFSKFLSKPAAPSPDPFPLGTTPPSHYTGGLLSLEPSSAPTHLPQYCHLHIAFEGLPISDPDIYALATLQTLLGGGGSFSAGGPGKGMYSRLYTNVLNQYGWIESAVAFNHSYTDSGLFGIAASCHPEAGHALVGVVLKELQNTFATGYAGLQADEVNRAKNQLRSSLLMNLESRMVELEDLGRQVQVYGKKISALEMSAKIEALTVADIRRVAQRVLQGKVENPGKGEGGATIVVQAGERQVVAMGDLMAQVKKFKLGR